MSIDKLQKKIRKLKSPILVDMTMEAEDIAPEVLEQAGGYLPAYEKVCAELMEGLRDLVAGVRFDYGCFAILGAEGLGTLSRLLKIAKEADYFVIVEGLSSCKPAVVSGAMGLNCDGLSISPYWGSDLIRPYAEGLKETEKSLFVTLRSPNRSASEVQDLMTGSRLVHQAAADILSRLGDSLIGKCGYTQIAAIGAANAPDSIRHLRTKYNRLFLLIDGYDYSNANAKNCSYAFDQFGHGAVICSATGIIAAWKEQETGDYVQAAVEAAQRMQKNILRYVSIL